MLLKDKNGPHLNKESEVGNSLVRIERSYRNIVLLKNQLCSYSCEPKTYKLFEEFEDLKLQLELLRLSHLKLIESLKSPVTFIESKQQQVDELINKTIALEQGVVVYIKLAK